MKDLQTPHELANKYYLASDGADASGRPTLDLMLMRAAQVADANGSGVVTWAPRIGGYAWRGAQTITNNARPLRFIGPGVSGQIVPDQSALGAGITMLTISAQAASAHRLTLEDVAIVGHGSGTDVGSVLQTGGDANLLLDGCVIVGLIASSHILNLSLAKFTMRNCTIGGCSASGNDWVHVLGGVWGHDIIDNLFGVGISGLPTASNASDNIFHFLGDSPSTQAQGIRLVGNVFNAALARSIWADPSIGNTIDLLELIRNEFIAGPSLALDVHDTSYVRGIGNMFAFNSGGTFPNIQTRATANVDTWIFEQNTFPFGTPFIIADLAGVRSARFSRNKRMSDGTLMTLRAGVGEVYLEENDARIGANLSVVAGSPRVRERFQGVDADYLTASGAIAINQAVQIAAAGSVQTAAAGADEQTIYGFAAQAIGNGAIGPIARRGQRGITVINDGASAIAIGTRVQPSPTTAGDVTAATMPTQVIGIAETVFAGGAGSTGTISGEVAPSTQLTGSDLPIFRANHAGTPYTLTTLQLNVFVDVSGGVVTLNLPAAPPDNTKIVVNNTAGDASVSNITVTRGGVSDKIQDPNNLTATPGTSAALNVKGASASWVYGATEGQWRVQ